MKQEEANQVLIQALDQAFKKGVYSLQDAGFIIHALEVLFPKPLEENTNLKN
jgi:hypothetical protein